MISLFSSVRCLECGHTMPPDSYAFQCGACGGFWLDAQYDCASLPNDWAAQLKERSYDLWRYQELFPFPDDWRKVSMGEGWTPLLRAEGMERETGHSGIWIKDERQHATGSFKDRQAAVAVSALKNQGVDEIVLASTGNAAAAYAAYCARAGIKLWVFVTGSVPAEKMRELALYGAEVIKITGTYDQAKTVAADFAARRNIYLDRGAKSIPCKESMKTIAFEIAEQMPRTTDGRWQAPDWYVQAVSGGIGPLGVLKGFVELKAAGIIDRIPKIAVVQTEGCSPMVRSWEKGLAKAEIVEQPDSLITVLATGRPGMAYEILKRASDEYGGAMVAVSDGEAFRAMRHIARLEGLSMEPAASVAFAGFDKLLGAGYIHSDEQVVINCSGHTFSAEKYTLEDRYIFNLTIDSPAEMRPMEGLTTALEELDEQITTIVLIDDNPYDSRLIRRLLKNHKHYRVFEAHSGTDGLDLVRQRRPDLVVLDLMMPGMDGFGVLDELKGDPRTAKIPVIIVSAKTLTKHDSARLKRHAESVWQKGNFSARQLVEHVVDVVEHDDRELIQAPEEYPSTAIDEQPLASFGKKDRLRILVVDDYVPEARLIRRLLETRQRFEVVEAHSGTEALDLIEKIPPDLIILDLMLPDISGEELLIGFRVSEVTTKTPVIVVTSKEIDPDMRARLAPNIDSIWSKAMLDRSSFLAHVEYILPE
ncbi:MAG: pyridoxal-phosphate dependent enzyme [Anaerolineae bacterium]|nr:pyridoxal-phosphate dependent enzyme [Anaerolineae bacterium]